MHTATPRLTTSSPNPADHPQHAISTSSAKQRPRVHRSHFIHTYNITSSKQNNHNTNQNSRTTQHKSSSIPQTPSNPTTSPPNHQTTKMPFFYSKPFGGRRAGGTITANRHGVHRPVFRFRLCGLNCFR
ncbi:hypothetical protein VTL71DRAFT_12282 [Oculimacula yallundae]|uniref:Uncharacterized protein n=1 Tax=Oculimacula yallundae TaxID=86028 RepID=A0ABR4CM57_9HELO